MGLNTVKLYGQLGARFGRVHRLAVDSGAEAVSALSVLIPGFEDYMRNADKRGLRFAAFIGERNISAQELGFGIGGKEFRIAPIPVGSKKGGLFQTILGAVMIVAGTLLTVFSGGLAAQIGGYMIMGGIGLVAGGVAQMLSPQPKSMQMGQDADNKPNYAFGAPVNTTAQGNVVGVLYGEREIGGAILSAGIIANEVRD